MHHTLVLEKATIRANVISGFCYKGGRHHVPRALAIFQAKISPDVTIHLNQLTLTITIFPHLLHF